jgi:CRP/FNR family transcriptional regulator, cyclic AMP receptor protein
MRAAIDSRFNKSKIKSREKNAFHTQALPGSAGMTRRMLEYRRSQRIYSQGDPATDVLYIEKGGVKLSVVNPAGKEAVLTVLGPGDFFGEGSLASQSVRAGTATAITSTTILVIKKNEMIRFLHAGHEFSDRFISHMLSRNIRAEGDLIDQLLNSAERRLARALLMLARSGIQDPPEKALPKLSQESLAGMIGATRSRVSFFLKRFTKMGFIGYDGGLHINPSLQSFVLRGETPGLTRRQLSLHLRRSLRAWG